MATTFTLVRADGTIYGTRSRKVSAERVYGSTTEVAAVLGPKGNIIIPIAGPDKDLRAAEVARDAFLNPDAIRAEVNGNAAEVADLTKKIKARKQVSATESPAATKGRRAASGKTLTPSRILEERDRRLADGQLPSGIDPRDAHHSLKMMLGYSWGSYGDLNLSMAMAKAILRDLDHEGYVQEDDILRIVKKHGGLVA